MRSPRIWFVALVTAVLLGVGSATPLAQDLSQQVLRLLVRNNHWTGVQTFDNLVGVTLESGLTAPIITTDRLYNVNGSLFWNGVLVGSSGGAGTVTSVGLSLPAIFTVSGSPVIASGTLTGTLATQAANLVWAGPVSGADAAPTFRALDADDLPPLPATGLTGVVPVANGGTGLSTGTSGGIPAFTAAGVISSSVALTQNALVLGGGAGFAPGPMASLGSTSTVLHGNAAGAPSFAQVNLTTTVTSVLPVANGGTGLASGTSGGVLAYTAAGTLASSAALTANRIVLGGGAGAAPTVLGSLGTTTTVLHGDAAGAPTFGAVSLTADVTGTLPVANGGTGATTLTGLLQGNGAGAVTAITNSSTVGQVLRVTGAATYAWGAVDLADADAVTGILAPANGGTGVNVSGATNGQLLIGNGTGLTLAALTGTANQVIVTNGVGSSTLSLPQSIATTSTPQFARLGLGTGAGATAVITHTGIINGGLFDAGNSGAALTITWTNGMVQKTTLTANVTFTFQDPIAAGTWFTLQLIQGAGAPWTATWPAAVVWDGGAAPTLSAVAGETDVCSFLWDGTNYYSRCIIGS
jgi:hypothetical protein